MPSIYYSSVPKGIKVHTKDNLVVMLTKDKKWNDKTFSGVVVYGSASIVGRYEDKWCSDIFYSHDHFPCDDSVLVKTEEF